MFRVLVLVAMLLITNVGEVAYAEEEKEQSKNAKKVIVILNSVGFHDKDVNQFVRYVDSRIDDGYVNFASEEVADGKISFQYELGTKIGTEQLQIKYAPKDSDFEYTARTNAVMVKYKYSF